jgi:alpha-1,3-rhamnosyltransferase
MSEVSVLVPSYNHARFVERTLRSVFAQTFPPKNLIVIDDGSKDESVAVIEKVLADCPFPHRLIARGNRGLCATLNEGFAAAEGEYFAYLGSDDVWLPEFLEDNVRLLESRPRAALAFGHAFVIDDEDMIFDRTDNWSDFADGDLRPVLLRGEIFSSPTVVYRRTALSNFRWNEDAALEDYEMYLKLTTVGEFARNPRILSAWRQHGTNTSRDTGAMFGEFISAQERLRESLGLGVGEMRRWQTGLKFRAAADFIRAGRRREALSLALKNVRGARSAFEIGKMLLRIAVPQPLFQWNRRRMREQAIRRYGRFDLGVSQNKWSTRSSSG